jgi:para-aminobenzoate synthetase component I
MPKAAKTPIPAAKQPVPASPRPDDPVRGVISRWPAEQPLAVLHSGDPARSGDHARWSLIARPARTSPMREHEMAGLLPPRLTARSAVPLSPADLPCSRAGLVRGVGLEYPPFTSGYLGYLAYDAGRLLEPGARHPRGATDDRAWPLAHWVRIDDALIYDHARAQWWGLGDCQSLVSALSSGHLVTPPAGRLFPLASTTGRDRFLSQVRRVLDYICAGDVYQVNLAHRLSGTFEGSSRGLFLSLSAAARPWYGAYLEFTDAEGRARAIASASPELFLDFDPRTRRITTRPMKGTRPGDADPRDLLDSPKDRAELNMITDLMRNDLGRVCEFGSVRVESTRDLERHGASLQRHIPTSPHHHIATPSSPAILQTTATITGRVRGGLSTSDILAATFPGGSVTGAPKIRAMQIIDELEPVARGPYCGTIGFLGDDSRMSLSIAIRTALLAESEPRAGTPRNLRASPRTRSYTLDYPVGAGIVADSDPESEWEETRAKAAILGTHAP